MSVPDSTAQAPEVPNTVAPPVHVHAVFLHQKASSACCGDKLQPPAEGAEHEFECAGCGQPTERVLSDGTEHHAYSDGHPDLAAQQADGTGA